MDAEIMKSIVHSHVEVMKSFEDPTALDRKLHRKFPILDSKVLSALTKSLTELISYKVSPKAYQRYSVKMQLIEVLRDWIRLPRQLENPETPYRYDTVLEFTAKITKIYLTNESVYNDDGNVEVLVNLARTLICLLPKRKSLRHALSRVLKQIAATERPTEGSKELLLEVLENRDLPELSPSLVESLYVSQRIKFVEEPLTQNLVENLKNTRDDEVFKSSDDLEKLLELCVEYPKIFHTSCAVLKEIFVFSSFSPEIAKYMKFFLTFVDSTCRRRNKDILNLYPLRFQALVILLRIDPEKHSDYSGGHVVESLEKIYSSNSEDCFTLLTHFPMWLPLLKNYHDQIVRESSIIVDMDVDE